MRARSSSASAAGARRGRTGARRSTAPSSARASSRAAISDSKRARSASVAARRAACPEAWARSFSSWRRTSSSSFSILTASFRFSVSSWYLPEVLVAEGLDIGGAGGRPFLGFADEDGGGLDIGAAAFEVGGHLFEAGAGLDRFELESEHLVPGAPRGRPRPCAGTPSKNSARLVSRSISLSRRVVWDLTA